MGWFLSLFFLFELYRKRIILQSTNVENSAKIIYLYQLVLKAGKTICEQSVFTLKNQTPIEVIKYLFIYGSEIL